MKKLGPADKEKCWEVIDTIFDNLIDANGGIRSPKAIEQIVGHPLRNPVLADSSLLNGVSLPVEIYKWCLTLDDINRLEEGIAELGQSKPFLQTLDQLLTTAERNNRPSTEADKATTTVELPASLLNSWSDKLALLLWARVRNNRPVNPTPADIPRTFEKAEEYANKIFDGMLSEPNDMVENIIQRKKEEKANKGAQAANNQASNNNNDQAESPGDSQPGQDRDGDGNVDAETVDEQQPKKVHAQVQRARDMSSLSKYIMSWELYVSFLTCH